MATSMETLLTSDRIPSLPELALRIVEIAQEPNPNFDELITVIKADPAICSRIMRTVNSALFGLRHRVSSIDAAVPMLGANMVRTLVLSFCLAENCRPTGAVHQQIQHIWRSSLTQAVAAESFALDARGVDDSVWFLGGLLQDIGRLALMAEAADVYGPIIKVYRDGPELLEAEQRAFGFTHVDVSVQLSKRWRLDHFLVDALGKHHGAVLAVETSLDQLETVSALPNALRCATLCADYICALREEIEPDLDRLVAALHDAFQVEPTSIDELLTDIDIRTNEVAAMFSIDIGDALPIETILAKAKKTLSDIALQSQLEVASVKRHIDDARRELENIKIETQSLRQESQIDSLTGAFSRKVLDECLGNAVQYCQAEQCRLGVAFVDVDSFKNLNDAFGHQVGDAALREVVSVIGSSLQTTDVVVRYGGDEFVVVMPVPDNEKLFEVVDTIRRNIAQLAVAGLDDGLITCSIGAISCDPSDDLRISERRLLEEADQAMYLAKQQGGNRIAAFELRGNATSAIPIPDTPIGP